MKVLFFVRDIRASSVTFIRRQIQLISEENEVLVVTIDHEPEFSINSFSCVGIPFQDSFWTNKPFRRLKEWDVFFGSFNPPFGKRLRAVVNDFEPDLIHCQFGTDALFFLDHFTNAKEIPVFIQFRGYDASLMYSKESYKRRLRALFKTSWIHPIYVSNDQYNRTLEQGIFPDKKRILYSCTDVDFFDFNPKNIGEEIKTFQLLQVGRLVEVKGHRFSLQAIQIASEFLDKYDIKIELLLAGEGPLFLDLKEEANQLGISEKVSFLGGVTPQEIREILSKADCLLHPSTTTKDGGMEGIPNAIMEALAVGMPAVATRHSGIAELWCENGGLFLFEEREIKNYAQIIIDLALKNLKFDPRISRNHIVKNFSTDQHRTQLSKFYHNELGVPSTQKAELAHES